MLAQSAIKGGWQAHVADVYADQDTQALAHQFCKIKVSANGFDAASLLSAINQLTTNRPVSGVIYGSGLESQPQLLKQIARNHLIIGNSAQQVEQVNNPRLFFKQLRKLKIPFPEVSFQAPEDLAGWLRKPAFSEGGKGIQAAGNRPLSNNPHYFQKQLSGNSYSALFLADGQHVNIIGFNRQYTTTPSSATPFIFTGIINQPELALVHQQQITQAIQKLVKAIGLKGLNSLDFMINDNACQILEINPRPSASMALYDQDFTQGLLTEHINACQGSLPQDYERNPPHPVRAYHIIYATEAVSIPIEIQWPLWSTDQPSRGTHIAAGEPVCAINAEAATVEHVEKLIQIRAMEIRNFMTPISHSHTGALLPLS